MDRLLDRPVTGVNDQILRARVRWLAPLIYFACLCAFVIDITVDIFYVPYGIFYIPLVCTAVLYRDPRWAWWLAAIGSVLVVIGFFLPEVAPNVPRAVLNRVLSMSAIWATAALVRYARAMWDALSEQSVWLKEAERVRTAVFTSLSEELRSPLHTLTGLATAMIATCRPDQREPLQLVRSRSTQLLASIENLIDLTHFDQRPIAPDTLDVIGVIRQAAEDSRMMAAERQISVELDLPGTGLIAQADPWAVRRILDNLIANAVKFSPAGSTVEVAAEAHSDAVALQVRDAGRGMPPDLLRRLRVPYDQTTPDMPITGAGLALSRRLARAMGADLLFDSEIGFGTVATLRLPA